MAEQTSEEIGHGQVIEPRLVKKVVILYINQDGGSDKAGKYGSIDIQEDVGHETAIVAEENREADISRLEEAMQKGKKQAEGVQV